MHWRLTVSTEYALLLRTPRDIADQRLLFRVQVYYIILCSGRRV